MFNTPISCEIVTSQNSGLDWLGPVSTMVVMCVGVSCLHGSNLAFGRSFANILRLVLLLFVYNVIDPVESVLSCKFVQTCIRVVQVCPAGHCYDFQLRLATTLGNSPVTHRLVY